MLQQADLSLIRTFSSGGSYDKSPASENALYKDLEISKRLLLAFLIPWVYRSDVLGTV